MPSRRIALTRAIVWRHAASANWSGDSMRTGKGWRSSVAASARTSVMAASPSVTVQSVALTVSRVHARRSVIS